jgi:hypothetical protein
MKSELQNILEEFEYHTFEHGGCLAVNLGNDKPFAVGMAVGKCLQDIGCHDPRFTTIRNINGDPDNNWPFIYAQVMYWPLVAYGS